MGVRAIRARIECDRETLNHLWRTHCVFNERLPQLLKLIFQMRRGECGRTKKERDLYRTLAQFVLDNSQNAEYLLNSISIKNWTPNQAKKYKAERVDKNGEKVVVTGDCWADDAARLSAKGVLLYEKQNWLGDVPASMRQMICRENAAIINGHEELTRNWQKEHDEWLARKTKWENDDQNQVYLRIRDKFEAFEQSVGGKAGKRRGRWHLYLDWLRNNPELAAWRGGAAVVHQLSPKAQQRINRAKSWKVRSIEAEEFWKANPELQALDKLHGYYEREFVRRRKTKSNVDGYDHRPTFTMPHSVNHPRWFVFNAPQTNPSGYRELQLPPRSTAIGSVQLQLLTGARNGESKYPSEWITVCFRADPRIAQFRTVQVPKKVNRGAEKGKTKLKDGYEFFDHHLHKPRLAEISGIKLLFRKIRLNDDGSLKSAIPYIVFTCTVEDLQLTEKAKKIEWSETGETTKSGKQRRSRKLPDGLVASAVDLGLRHVGFATLCVFENGKPQVLRSRSIWLDRERGGPDLAHIGRHKRIIKSLRRQRGKPVKGEQSHTNLQSHITKMGEDRFKKAARAIINFAWNCDQSCDKRTGVIFPRADVIILERLEGFIPDAEKERGINRALAAWNRGQLVERVLEMAAEAGYKGRIFQIHPAGTSQVCSRCGALGRRYSIARDEETRLPDIRFGWVEKLFACPECGYRANSDHNASLNLHRKFLMGDPAVSAFFEWRNQPETVKRSLLDGIDEELREPLRKLHNLSSQPIETPF